MKNTLDSKLSELLKIPEVPGRSYMTMRNFHQRSYKHKKAWTVVKEKLHLKSVK